MYHINSELSFTERFCSGVIVDANAEFEMRNEHSFLVIENKKKDKILFALERIIAYFVFENLLHAT